jgi:hypothetical protein
MKKLFALFISVFISTIFLAQQYEAKEKWSFMNTKYINVTVVPQYSGGGGPGGFIPPGQGGTIDIDWGDGNHDSIPFNHTLCSMDMTFGYGILAFQHSFNHNYALSGTYNLCN